MNGHDPGRNSHGSGIAWNKFAVRAIGCSWRDRDGAVRPAGRDGILVVTLYNAQIRAIQDALAARGLTGFRVGPSAARPRW